MYSSMNLTFLPVRYSDSHMYLCNAKEKPLLKANCQRNPSLHVCLLWQWWVQGVQCGLNLTGLQWHPHYGYFWLNEVSVSACSCSTIHARVNIMLRELWKMSECMTEQLKAVVLIIWSEHKCSSGAIGNCVGHTLYIHIIIILKSGKPDLTPPIVRVLGFCCKLFGIVNFKLCTLVRSKKYV